MEPYSSITRTRGLSATSGALSLPAGSPLQLIFPSTIEPRLAESLRYHAELRDRLDPPVNALLGLASSLLSWRNTHGKDILSKIERHLSVHLLVGPLYSGRVSEEKRASYLQRLEETIDRFNDCLQNLLQQDNVSPDLAERQLNDAFNLPAREDISDERGYYEDSTANQAQKDLKGLKRHVEELKKLNYARSQEYQQMTQDFSDLQKQYENSKASAIAMLAKLQDDARVLEGQLHAAQSAIERHKATLEAEHRTRVRDEEEQTTKICREIEAESQLLVDEIKRKGQERVERLLLKRKVVYFNYKEADLPYVRPWLAQFEASVPVTFRHLSEGWFLGCQLPRVVALVTFIEEPSCGLGERDFALSKELLEAIKIESGGACTNSIIVRLQPQTGSLAPSTVDEHRLHSYLSSGKYVIYGQLSNQWQPDNTQRRVIAADRDDWHTAKDLLAVISAVTSDT